MRCVLVGLVFVLVAQPLRADEPRDIVERAIKAQGGTANLQHWTALRATVNGTIKADFGEIKTSGIWLFAAPDREKVTIQVTRSDVDAVFETMTVSAGDKGWTRWHTPGREPSVLEMKGDMMVHLSANRHESYVSMVLPLVRDRKFTLTSLPPTTVKGRPAVGVRASYPGQPDVSVFFDKETHLLVKTSYETTEKDAVPGAAPVLRETLFSDYREVGFAEQSLLEKAGIKTDASSLRAHLNGLRPDRTVAAKAATLVEGLGNPAFEEREKASTAIVALGAPAIPVLKEALRNKDAEIAQGAKACLEKIGLRVNPDTSRAAVRLLVLRAPASAAETLLSVLPDAEEELIEDIRAALVPLAQRAEGPDPVLVRALDDKDATRRETARVVLGKDDGVWLKRPGRRLLMPGARFWSLRTQNEGAETMEIRLTDLYNRLDDKEFAKP